MQTESQFFNILTFDWPTAKANFYFGLEEIGHCQKIHKSIFPNEIETIFPGVTTDGTETIYTTFTGEREGFTTLEIDLPNENPHFAKRYYDRQINYYFRAIKEQIVKVGFIKENQVWLPVVASDINTANKVESPFDFYERYSLKVQIKSVSSYPEIQLSYDGKSRVLKRSLADIIGDISPINFKWVLHNGQLYKFDTLAENGIDDYENVFPVVNTKLFRALGFEFPAPSKKKKNKYLSYLQAINDFKTDYLNAEEFKAIIPLHEGGFLKVNPAKINRTNQDGNQLLFGAGKLHVSPYYGIKEGGAYANTPFSKIHFFLIFHKDDFKAASDVKSHLEKGFEWYRGLQKLVKILSYRAGI